MNEIVGNPEDLQDGDLEAIEEEENTRITYVDYLNYKDEDKEKEFVEKCRDQSREDTASSI